MEPDKADQKTLEKVADYLKELANHVTPEDASDLPKFLRVLAQRMKDGELVE